MISVVLLTGCNYEYRIAQKNNRFRLKQRIDTIRHNFNELEIADSGIVKSIDTLILVTESLPQYNKKIPPKLSISFGRSLKDSSIISIYESADNLYSVPEDTLFFWRDSIMSSTPKYGILKYKGYKIFVYLYNDDDPRLYSEMAFFFKPLGRFITNESYLFYSKKRKRYLDALPIWENTLEFKRIGDEVIFFDMYQFKL